MDASEANFDGLAGPTHNYSGLSSGNVASELNKQTPSNPKEAALQGLEKMELLMELGLVQGILPPHERPDLEFLRQNGFSGKDHEIITAVARTNPKLLRVAGSASNLWSANAATVSPSADTADGKVHFTPANLVSNQHRALETRTTARLLQIIFKNKEHFLHHPPLSPPLRDEGAANHTRLCEAFGEPGVHLFVYGESARGSLETQALSTAPDKETASQAIAQEHGLKADHTFIVQQNPEAIDAGVFHNDVISVGHQNVFLFHEKAFVDTKRTIETLRKMQNHLIAVEVTEKDFGLADAVSSYFFNSQIISSDGRMTLIAPVEARENKRVNAFIDLLLVSNTPIKKVHFCDLRQSMKNGGGPACLRLRVVLTPNELQSVHKGVILTEDLLKKLRHWVISHYRDRLIPDDLGDAALLTETRTALDELTNILNLGNIYDFQK